MFTPFVYMRRNGSPRVVRRHRQLRQHGAVRPDHVSPEIERIVERPPDYWIVEKFGEAAQETDPRSKHILAR